MKVKRQKIKIPIKFTFNGDNNFRDPAGPRTVKNYLLKMKFLLLLIYLFIVLTLFLIVLYTLPLANSNWFTQPLNQATSLS